MKHPEIKAEEIMGGKSVILTYRDHANTAETSVNEMTLNEAKEWIENGVVEDDVVVTPPLPDSEDEEEVAAPPVEKRRRPVWIRKKKQPLVLSRRTLVLAVLFLGAGILAYQGRRRGGGVEYLLGIVRGRQTFDVFQDVWEKIRMNRMGERTVWGRIKDLL